MSERRHRERDEAHDPQRSKEDLYRRAKRAPQPRIDEPDGARDTRRTETHRSSRSERQSSSRLPRPAPIELTEKMMNMALGSDAPKNPSAPSEVPEYDPKNGQVIVQFDKKGKLRSIRTRSSTQPPWGQDGRQAEDTPGRSLSGLKCIAEGLEPRATRPRDRTNSTYEWLDRVPSPTRTDLSFANRPPLESPPEEDVWGLRIDGEGRSFSRRHRTYADNRTENPRQMERSHGQRDQYTGEPEQRSTRRTYEDPEPPYDEWHYQGDPDRRKNSTISRKETSRGGGKRRSSTEKSVGRATEPSYQEPTPRSTGGKRYGDELSGSDITVRPSSKPSHAHSKKSRRPPETAAEPSRSQAEQEWLETDTQATRTPSSYNTRPVDHQYCTGPCCVPPPSQYYSPRRAGSTVGPSHGGGTCEWMSSLSVDCGVDPPNTC
jgi:hypothetical protein